MAITVLLVFINSESNRTTVLCRVGLLQLTILVPLSGYETRQEFTYNPNLTGTAIPYSNLIPAAFQKPSAEFIPHTFTIGDTFQTNSNLSDVFEYIMQSAYTREDAAGSSAPRAVAQVPSFVYSNYDFSMCDVLSVGISVHFNLTWQQTTADVCRSILQSSFFMRYRFSLAAGSLSFISFTLYTQLQQVRYIQNLVRTRTC